MNLAKRKKITNYIKRENIITRHIQNNLREYIIISIIFLIGVIIGVIFINNLKENQQEIIKKYINNFIESINNQNKIDKTELLKVSIISNIKIFLYLSVAGLTVIGAPILYIIICYRGFCLGYTLSAIIATLGIKNGILFIISTIFLQNLILIPCIFSIAISGIKLYKAIIKEKKRENIKVEILRHAVFSVIILVFMIFASFIETYISTTLFNNILNYIVE